MKAESPSSISTLDSYSIKMSGSTCCLCDSTRSRKIAEGKDYEYRTTQDTYSIHECECGHLFLNPRPALSELSTIYPDSYHAFQFAGENYGVVHKIRQKLESRRLSKLLRGLPRNAKILDVGCGDGFHLELLQQNAPESWTLHGIDADGRAVEAAKRRGFQVRQMLIEDLDPIATEPYDAILMMMLLEHVPNPAALLKHVHRLLRPGGTAIVVTDRTGNIDFRLFKKRYWGGYHFPRHWHLFNMKGIQDLAYKSGFRVSRLETIASPVNWVYSIRNMLCDRNAPAWLLNRFSLTGVFALTAFTLLDQTFNSFRRGALIRACLVKPAGNSSSE